MRRNAHADLLTAWLEEIPGLEVQKRGLKASPGRQSYYCLIIKYDPEAWSGMPLDSLLAAVRAEGLPAGATYGTVHRHSLWNIPAEQYRIHGDWRDALGASCRVSEEIGTHRSIAVMHSFLDLASEDLRKIADVFQKLHTQSSSLNS